MEKSGTILLGKERGIRGQTPDRSPLFIYLFKKSLLTTDKEQGRQQRQKSPTFEERCTKHWLIYLIFKVWVNSSIEKHS